MRRIALIALFAVVTAACASGSTSPSASTSSAAPSDGSVTTTSAAPSPSLTTGETFPDPMEGIEPSTTTAAPPEPEIDPDAPEAPDFTVALGQGGVFSLSEEQKPVYLVFWAEW